MQYRSLALLLLLAAACGSSSSSNASDVPPPGGNGVNDVLLACQSRATWANASASSCNECIGLTESVRCACTDRDYAGRCSNQETARLKEPTCDGVDTCVGRCDRVDCTCIDACYAGKPACRTLASAADGCIAEICDSYCR